MGKRRRKKTQRDMKRKSIVKGTGSVYHRIKPGSPQRLFLVGHFCLLIASNVGGK